MSNINVDDRNKRRIKVEEKTNKVTFCGEIKTQPKYSHEMFGEKFYELKVAIKRLSGVVDELPVTISERLNYEYEFSIGSIINATAQFRSFNKIVDGKSRLMLTLFVTEILDSKNINHENDISISGYICKPPVYRITPFNREIADILIAVNRSYNKSDYIPCIAWGRNAKFCEKLKVGEKIAVLGRIQSRDYQKCVDEKVTTRTAYEVSISKIYVGEKIEEYEKEVAGEI